MGAATASASQFVYRRHEPEKTLLYRTFAREWETWVADWNQADFVLWRGAGGVSSFSSAR